MHGSVVLLPAIETLKNTSVVCGSDCSWANIRICAVAGDRNGSKLMTRTLYVSCLYALTTCQLPYHTARDLTLPVLQITTRRHTIKTLSVVADFY